MCWNSASQEMTTFQLVKLRNICCNYDFHKFPTWCFLKHVYICFLLTMLLFRRRIKGCIVEECSATQITFILSTLRKGSLIVQWTKGLQSWLQITGQWVLASYVREIKVHICEWVQFIALRMHFGKCPWTDLM